MSNSARKSKREPPSSGSAKSKTASKSATGFPLTPQEAEPLDELLARLKIDEWDFLIFGDGSGSNWDRECAWASVSIERDTMERKTWYGYANVGSISAAEGMAYLWPAMWLANRLHERVKSGGRRKAYQVHVITDSTYVQSTGEKDDRMLAKNGVLWEAFDAIARQGVVMNWHWIKRETAGLNQYTDQLSRMVRLCFREYNMQQRMATGGNGGEVVKTVYEVNPG